MEEALKDFRQVFFNEQSEELVILMLSLFAFSEINHDELEYAQRTQDREERENLVEYAFQILNSFAKQLNYLFDQSCLRVQHCRFTTAVYCRTEVKPLWL